MSWLNKNKDNIAFIVPSRLGSTRIPRKVLKPFANSSLFEIALQKLSYIKNIDKSNIYIQVREKELVEIAGKYDFQILDRSENSLKEPITLPEVYDWWDKLQQEYYIRLNICNPLITTETIDDFIQTFINSPKGLFAVLERKTFYFNKDNKLVSNFLGDPKYLSTLETKRIEPLYEAAHTLYAGKCSDIGNSIYMGSFLEKEDPSFYILNDKEFGDIDEIWQFELYEQIYKKRFLND